MGMIERKRTVLLGVFLLAVCLAASAPAPDTAASAAARTITVVMDDNYPPYVFRNDRGRLQGFLVDEWKLWSRKTGITAVVRGMEWSRAQDLVARGKADVIDTLFFTPQRARLFDYSPPYATIDVRLYYSRKTGRIDLRRPETFRRFTIGVKEGDACIEELKRREAGGLRPYRSYVAMIRDAAAGKLLAFCMDGPPARYLLYKAGVSADFRDSSPLYTGRLHRAVLKGRTDLLLKMESGFGAVTKAEREELAQRWLGPRNGADLRYLRYLAAAGGAVVAAALLLFFWSQALRVRVRRRTADLKNALDGLKRSEDELTALYNETPVMLHSIDRSGRLVKVNDYWLRTMGYDRAEVLGRKVTDFYTDSSRRYADEVVQPGFFRDGSCRDVPLQFVKKNGETVDVLLSATGERDATGAVLRSRAVITDITERKQAERQLQEYSEKARQYFDIAGVMFGVLDADGRVRIINPRGCEILGYGHDEIVGQDWFARYVPERLRADVRDVFLRLMAGDVAPVEYYENPIVRRDGTERIIAFHNMIVRDSRGAAAGVLFSGEDITDRTRAEAALRENEARFRAVFDNSVDAIGVSKKGVHVFVNPAYVALFGYGDNGELAGRPILDLIAPSERDRVRGYAEQRARGDPAPASYETRGLRRDGAEFSMDVHVSTYRSGEETYTVVILRDITARKAAESGLRASEEKYRLLFTANPLPMMVYDTGSLAFLAVNDAAVEHYGYSPGEFLSMTLRDIRPPEDVPKLLERLRNVAGTLRRVGQARHRRKDGSLIEVEVTTHEMVFEGRPARLVLAADITERKRAAEALQASEKKFRDLLENIHHVAVMLDREGSIIFCNSYLLDLTGWTREEVLHGNWFALFLPPDQREEVRSFFSSSLARGEILSHYENPIVTRGGALRRIVWDNTLLYDAAGAVAGVASIGIDVTEHRRTEEQLRQAQKMEAVGQLAGGIAHDFNNILSAIVGYSSLMMKNLEADDRNRHFLGQILESAERAAALTQGLLAFSRKQTVNLARIDLNEVVAQFRKLLARLLREDIELVTRQGERPVDVLADRGQIEQVLLNLVTNARDAMPRGGTIVIETRETAVDREAADARGLPRPGAYGLVEVTDTGTGMTDEVKQKLFEPFFTTKEEGKGTGLGLATVYGIVKKHQGAVDVYSEQGRGTTFRIYLPGALPAAAAEAGARPAEEEPAVRGGSETVLLAEDDEKLRVLTRTVLKGHGYEVIEAADGQEAVSLFRRDEERIRLVILDGIMPKMNGRDAWEQIRKIRPEVRAIFISGYAEDIFTKDGIPDGTTAFLQKPQTPSDLLRKVREVLDR